MAPRKIRMAVIGMGFGAVFAEIYRLHPDVEHVGICDTNRDLLASFTGYSRRHDSYAEALESDEYDAVHICTPVTMHVEPVLAALKRGKHVACAVPMAMKLADLDAIISAQRSSGRNYMMMETMVYGRDCLYVKDLYGKGAMGRIQFMRGCHSQDLEDINPVWRGLPPMWYMTHAVSPLLDILDTRARAVQCCGSGHMREEFRKAYGNPYPIETATLTLEGTAARAEVTRTLFETAPYGDEAFDVFGELATFAGIGHGKRPRLVKISPLVKTGAERVITEEEPEIPFRTDLLPEALRTLYTLPEPMRRFALWGHGGSHTHLVHEFIRSILEERQPYIHARKAADWCAAGICAHESAMRDGARVEIPSF
jgi:predicted dehydrogenase